MNTAILTDKEQIHLEQRPAPKPDKGEVIVEVAYCGVCRTDRKCYQQGQRDLHLPRILGHEFCGIVKSVGPGVENIAIGDAVTIHPGIACGNCNNCKGGNDQRCHDMKIFGFHLDGGFSRYCKIPASGVQQGILRKIPEGVSLLAAAMCEPLGCAVHMTSAIPDLKEKSVLILGGGVLGTLMAKLLRYEGADSIVITEPVDYKRNLLCQLGFHATLPQHLNEIKKELTIDVFEIAIPCSPYSECFATAANQLNSGGFLAFFSGLTDDNMIDKNVLNQIHYKELTMKGSYGCGAEDTKRALKLIADGFPIDDLPFNLIPLEAVESTLKQQETNHALFTIIQH